MAKCPNCGHVFVEGATPTVEPTKAFPWKVEFERATTQGNGRAGVLFRTLKPGDIKAVTVNGELATEGKPYNGGPVFLMSKPGEQYSRPLRMIITMADGQTYTATTGTGETPSGPATTGDYDHKATYTSYGVRNGGRQAWRISKSGKDLGAGPIKFVFATFIVKNPLRNCRDQENCSRNSKAAMYGFVYKPGIGPNGDGDNDTGTSHGGIYLHAPYGDSSKTVTMYW